MTTKEFLRNVFAERRTWAAGIALGVWRLWEHGTPFSGAWTLIGVLAAVALLVLYAAPQKFVISAIAAGVYDVCLPAVLVTVTLLLWPLFALWAWFWNRVYLTLGSEEWVHSDQAENP